MVVEEITITLSGGAPWGFRLQGGVEHQRPLQVAKVRKRSKACRAGLREGDELVSINENSCASLSHAQAMNLIDSIPGSLRIRVKRAPVGFQSVVLVARAPSPRIDKEYRAALKAKSPSSFKLHQPNVRQVHQGSMMSPTAHSGLTSPLGSEAYYGETDSDADVAAHDRHRKPKRRSPSNTPGKAARASSEMGEMSEMSGYDSAPDAQNYTQVESQNQEDNVPGVARREVVYQPTPSGAWSSYTSTETSSVSADEQSSQDLVLEEDSGFQELTNVPLVSPERAKGALMLSSHSHLVPMVGPVNRPVDEELTKTYMDKAKQAKLNRGETQQDKQVKEARTKCRTIASLLTDAPNPHSKGVLMFKKRRQRSKKYTLTSYGSVDEDIQPDSQDEDSQFLGSESEVDEEGFSAAPDPTWDSDYLDMLEKRSASRGLEGGDAEDSLSPGLSNTTGKGARLFEQQRKRAEEHAKKMTTAMAQQGQVQSHTQPEIQQQIPELLVQTEKLVKPSIQPPPVAPKPSRPPEMVTQDKAPVTKTVLLVPSPQVTPLTTSEDTASNKPAVPSVVPVRNQPITIPSSIEPPPPTPLPELPPSSVLNRTARPFAPGFISHRAATAPVVFRPNTTKKTPRPISVAVVAQPFSVASEEKVPLDAPPVRFTASQQSTEVSAEPPSTSTHRSTVFLPPAAAVPEPAQPLTPHLNSSMDGVQTVPSAAQAAVSADCPFHTTVVTVSPPIILKEPNSMTPVAPALSPAPETTTIPASSMTSAVPASPISSVSPVANQEKAPMGSGRTGILQEARRRSSHKPLFRIHESKKNSPNPELLSMVQNLDDRHKPGHSERVTFSLDTYSMDERSEKFPPPVAPKPRVISEIPQIAQAEGKGAELFARRQNRKDLFVVDSLPSHAQYQQQPPQPHSVMTMFQPHEPSSTSSNWKYSPNVRAPPPISYNPLLSPSCPLGAQRGRPKGSEVNSKVGRSAHGIHKEGIKAIEVMRRQPYQLNSAMFSFGGGSSTHSTGSTYQNQRQPLKGHTLAQPRQVPVKAARVYEIKRFSTPTPMSAPTITPTVIVPRAHTSLAEPLSRSDMTSPTPTPASPPPQHLPEPPVMPARAPGLPELPKISAAPVFLPTPYSPPAPTSNMSTYTGLESARQFKSAPELSALPPKFLKSPVQAPKPRFIATRIGIQPQVWRPGAPQY